MLVSFILTLGIFVSLPFIDIISEPKQETIAPHVIDTLEISLPMPEQTFEYEKPPLTQTEPHRKELLEQLPVAEQNFRPVAPAFSAGFGTLAGDFQLQFSANDFSFSLGALDDAFDLFDLDEAPVPLLQIAPAYPPGARYSRKEGNVKLEFVISSEGLVENAMITESVPEGVFDNSILATSRSWRFKPGIKDGKPVKTRVHQRFRFRLD